MKVKLYNEVFEVDEIDRRQQCCLPITHEVIVKGHNLRCQFRWRKTVRENPMEDDDKVIALVEGCPELAEFTFTCRTCGKEVEKNNPETPQDWKQYQATKLGLPVFACGTCRESRCLLVDYDGFPLKVDRMTQTPVTAIDACTIVKPKETKVWHVKALLSNDYGKLLWEGTYLSPVAFSEREIIRRMNDGQEWLVRAVLV